MYGFFGRGAELASLRAAAAEALLHGQVTVAVVEGDAGLGKSRLLAEFLRELPSACTSTVSVACYQPDARLPLSLAWTLSDALGNPGLGGAQSREVDPGGGWATLAEIVHRAVSAGAPAVIVVDDVQWCDEVSVGVLHYLVRGAVAEGDALLLVLAARPSPMAVAVSDAMARLPAVTLTHVPLGALDDEAALGLVSSLDPDLDEMAAADVAARAGGSPFWCRYLAAASDRQRPAGKMLARRLRSMSGDATALLATCIVLARPLESTRSLRSTAGLTPAAVPRTTNWRSPGSWPRRARGSGSVTTSCVWRSRIACRCPGGSSSWWPRGWKPMPGRTSPSYSLP